MKDPFGILPIPEHSIDTVEPSEANDKPVVSRWEYFTKYRMIFKTVSVLIDEITDVSLIVTLFYLHQYWFATFYMAADILPAVIIMWHKYQSEQSWKVLVWNHFLSLEHNNLFHQRS